MILKANNASGYQVEGYGGSPIRNNKELSPLIRLMKGHEGSPMMQQQQRNYLEGANSWDSNREWIRRDCNVRLELIRRPVETKIERYHKIENWKKELDVQIQEQKVKKQVEEEERRNQKIKDENRYNRQLEELMIKNRELRKSFLGRRC